MIKVLVISEDDCDANFLLASKAPKQVFKELGNRIDLSKVDLITKATYSVEVLDLVLSHVPNSAKKQAVLVAVGKQLIHRTDLVEEKVIDYLIVLCKYLETVSTLLMCAIKANKSRFVATLVKYGKRDKDEECLIALAVSELAPPGMIQFLFQIGEGNHLNPMDGHVDVSFELLMRCCAKEYREAVQSILAKVGFQFVHSSPEPKFIDLPFTHCASCYRYAPNDLWACARCQMVAYCGGDCQRAHYRSHKHICKQVC